METKDIMEAIDRIRALADEPPPALGTDQLHAVEGRLRRGQLAVGRTAACDVVDERRRHIAQRRHRVGEAHGAYGAAGFLADRQPRVAVHTLDRRFFDLRVRQRRKAAVLLGVQYASVGDGQQRIVIAAGGRQVADHGEQQAFAVLQTASQPFFRTVRQRTVCQRFRLCFHK